MVLVHVIDSWTRPADRTIDVFYTLSFVGGLASPLFLFLAGVATALSAASKGRAEGSHVAGARLARRRGWEILALSILFRIQAQVLGLGPLQNLFKVDMLNIMGLSMVLASCAWQVAAQRRWRLALCAAVTGAIAMSTPIVRTASWLAALPDPLEAYLRPAGPYAAFPMFPWTGFLFAGVIVGDLVDAARRAPARETLLQTGIALGGGAGVLLAWLAAFQPSIYRSASFWDDSPTFFFIRLGLVALFVPMAWVFAQIMPAQLLQPLAILGRSSLFVYWIHVEMVFGVIAEPIKHQLPLWGALVATAVMCVLLYALVQLKNRLLTRYELRGPWRLLAPVVRA
jgi:uncharacterized membrane protein